MDDQVRLVRTRLDARSPARPAFDLLIAHAEAAGFRLVPYTTGAVWSVELQWPDRRRNPFSAQTHANYINFYIRSPLLSGNDELFNAAVAAFGPVAANGRDEYRTHLQTVRDVDRMLDFLRERGVWPGERHARRFRAEWFATVDGGHLLAAAEAVASGSAGHQFGESTRYDALFDGRRLPPKAVFGLAASAALGFPVGPENFSGGEGTVCFRILRSNGYPVVEKLGPAHPPMQDLAASDEDRAWTEGRPRLVTHLQRERRTGVAAAKRDSFRQEHGKLFCERCGMDPVGTFGPAGEACIEVHHRETAVAEMTEGHRTLLRDLECLCANCHRVTHRELRDAVIAEDPSRAR